MGHARAQALTDVVLALALVLLGGVVAALFGQWLLARFGVPMLLTLLLQGVVILAGLQVLLAWRREGWRQIGFGPLKGRHFGLALITLLAIFALNLLVSLATAQIAPELLETHQVELSRFALMLTGDLPLAVIAGAMLFTGFYEEVLARGFLLNRCRRLMPGIWGPVLLSSALFGLGHAYQGWLGVLQTALVGVLLARLFIRWGTLWPLIIAHAALNTLSLMAFRAFN